MHVEPTLVNIMIEKQIRFSLGYHDQKSDDLIYRNQQNQSTIESAKMHQKITNKDWAGPGILNM